jgi:rod shape determining protein RodA
MQLKNFNIWLFLIPLSLGILGCFQLISIYNELFYRQLFFLILSVIAYFIVLFIDSSFYKYYWYLLYLILIICLLYLAIVSQDARYGSVRWIDLGFFSFQPSEFVKLLVVFIIGDYLVSTKNISHYKNVFYLGLKILPFLVLILLQPDLGTTLAIIIVSVFLLFMGGLNINYFLIAFILFGFFSYPLWNSLEDYQKDRVLIFFNPELDVLGKGYNVVQSKIAIGSGGFFGKGFGYGTQSAYKFLPTYWTDFIFASFSEEFGFIGVLLLFTFFISLFGLLIYTYFKVEDLFPQIIILGVFIILFFQFTINVGMNLGVMPVTGIPLPFISYGGSSLLLNFIMLGIVQGIWVNSVKKS